MLPELQDSNISSTTLLVGHALVDGNGLPTGDATSVPTTSQLKHELLLMLMNTRQVMLEYAGELDDGNGTDTSAEYTASEKYSSKELVQIPLSHEYCDALRLAHNANQHRPGGEIPSDPDELGFYGAVFVDANGRRFSGWRQATYLKRSLKKKFIYLTDDSYTLHEDPMFQLDQDFDLLCDDTTVYIWRASAFESLLRLQPKIREAAAANLSYIEGAVGFLDLASITEFVSGSMRAARCLSSIAKGQLSALDATKVEAELKRTKVPFSVGNGKLSVEPAHALAFLYVLDRRRYVTELTLLGPEIYAAASRRKLN